MESSNVQSSVQQDSTRESTSRKRVRNWRSKLSQSSQVATSNNSTSVVADNMSEPDIKVKISSNSNDEAQKSPKLDAMNKATVIEQRDGNSAKNEQISPKPIVQTSSRSSGSTTSKNKNQDSSKLSSKTSPKSSDAIYPKNNDQGSPKPNIQVPSSVDSPKGNVSGSKNKRRRNKGAVFKNNAENQQNSQLLNTNVSDEVNKAQKVSMLKEDNKDKEVEKHKVVEIPSTVIGKGSTNDQSSLNKHADVTLIEPNESGDGQQTTKDQSISGSAENNIQKTPNLSATSKAKEKSIITPNEANSQLITNDNSEIGSNVNKELKATDNEKGKQHYFLFFCIKLTKFNKTRLHFTFTQKFKRKILM